MVDGVLVAGLMVARWLGAGVLVAGGPRAGGWWPKPIHTQSPHSKKEIPNIFVQRPWGIKV